MLRERCSEHNCFPFQKTTNGRNVSWYSERVQESKNFRRIRLRDNSPSENSSSPLFTFISTFRYFHVFYFAKTTRCMISTRYVLDGKLIRRMKKANRKINKKLFFTRPQSHSMLRFICLSSYLLSFSLSHSLTHSPVSYTHLTLPTIYSV